jgi:hypothetical protein
VRACAAPRPLASNVRVTVTSTLELKVSQDGVVESARFEPPLAPEVQACAAETIYKTRFEQGGTVTIPFEMQR